MRSPRPLSLWAISPWLPKATIAIEDRRFYHHGGVDYRAILRAAIADLRAGRIVEGGSTITQELVRNLYIGHPQRTLGRKIEEACLANKLADRWTKGQILAAYLNEVFYGHHAYGAQAGAQTYFSREARALTLPQAALLAGLPQAPSVYDPIRRPESNSRHSPPADRGRCRSARSVGAHPATVPTQLSSSSAVVQTSLKSLYPASQPKTSAEALTVRDRRLNIL